MDVPHPLEVYHLQDTQHVRTGEQPAELLYCLLKQDLLSRALRPKRLVRQTKAELRGRRPAADAQSTGPGAFDHPTPSRALRRAASRGA